MSLLYRAGVDDEEYPDGLDAAEISAASGFRSPIKRDCPPCGPHSTEGLSVNLPLSTSAALTAMAELAPCDGSAATRLRAERKEKRNVSLAAPE